MRLPEDEHDLIKTISDASAPTEHRVIALLALHTDIHSEDITLTSSYESLGLRGLDVLFIPLMLRLIVASDSTLCELITVKDIVTYVDRKPI